MSQLFESMSQFNQAILNKFFKRISSTGAHSRALDGGIAKETKIYHPTQSYVILRLPTSFSMPTYNPLITRIYLSPILEPVNYTPVMPSIEKLFNR